MRQVTSFTIKWIAFITMFIDHFAAIVLRELIEANGIVVDMNDLSAIPDWNALGWAYFISRTIGRIAFPLYLFLMVQGVEHSRRLWLYFLNVVAFTFISEIPYDLAFSGTTLEFGRQNIFFELSLVLAAMIGIKYIEKKIDNRFFAIIIAIIYMEVIALASLYLRPSYTVFGILAGGAMYLLRGNPAVSYMLGVGLLMVDNGYIGFAALLALPLVSRYDGSRGRRLNKYVFYSLYPAHLLILAGVKMLLR